MGVSWGSFHQNPDYRHRRRRSGASTDALREALLSDPEDSTRPLAPEVLTRAREARRRHAERHASVELSLPMRVLVFVTVCAVGMGLAFLVIRAVAAKLAEIM